MTTTTTQYEMEFLKNLIDEASTCYYSNNNIQYRKISNGEWKSERNSVTMEILNKTVYCFEHDCIRRCRVESHRVDVEP